MFLKRSVWLLLVIITTLSFACQNQYRNQDSNLAVAGGKADTGSDAKYASTVYVKVHALKTNGSELEDVDPIESVGTVLNLPGFDGYTVIALSLADSYEFEYVNGQRVAVLPPLVNVSLSIYPDSRDQEPVTVKKLSFGKDGKLSKGAKLAVVGAKLVATGAEIPARLRKYDVEGAIAGINRKIFVPGTGLQHNGFEYRNYLTSYLLVALPHRVLKGSNAGKLKAIRGANVAGLGSSKQFNMVGFGGTHKKAGETRRNYARVKLASNTGLSRSLSGSGFYGSQLFEVTGSGLCEQQGSSAANHRSYDTGASLYNSKGEFVGFAVRSESKVNGFRGYDCRSDKLSNITTLVVAPTQAQLNHLAQ